MNTQLLLSAFSDVLIRATCWTLVHSLWQGIVLAVFAGFAVMLTKKSNPFLRYHILSGLFFLFFITVCTSFWWQMRISSAISQDENHLSTMPERLKGQISSNLMAVQSDPVPATEFGRFAAFLDRHAQMVVMIWFILFSARFVQVLANLRYISRIRYQKTNPSPAFWTKRLQELASGLGIKKHIGLFESALIKVPLMFGYIKPLILVPVGLLAQLPPEQVEAILLHELAHIKRKDYLINLLQTFGETIFFFHPAVAWVSSLIREERENCCDDLAIQKTKSKQEFIYALMAFQEYQESNPSYAIGFARDKNHLLDRVKRIITNHNKTLNNMEKVFLASSIVLTGFLTVSFSQTVQQNPAPAIDSKSATGRTPNSITGDGILDSIPTGKEKIQGIWKTDIDWNGKNYRITEKNNKVTELYIDDQRIPDEKIAGYMPQIDEIRKSQKEHAAILNLKESDLRREQSELEKKQKELMRQMEDVNRRQSELDRQQERISGRGEEDLLRHSADEQKMEMDKQAMMLEKLRREQDELVERKSKSTNPEILEHNRKMLEEYQKDMENHSQGELQEYLQKAQAMADMHNKQLDELNKGADERLDMLKKAQEDARKGLSMEGADKATIQELLQKVKQKQEDLAYALSLDAQTKGMQYGMLHPNDNDERGTVLRTMHHRQIELIIDQLMDEKIISSPKNISFELNSKEFILNGVKQSPEFYSGLKERFIVDKEDHFIYSNNGNSTHIDVHTSKGDENLTEKMPEK
jgi:beta-lactamase regulating signal transducer with metallopeptidase domain